MRPNSIQNIGEHPSPCVGHPFSLLLHGVGVLEHVVAHLTRAEESLALWTQANKLLHRQRIQFVLEESDCLAIHSGDGLGGTH